MAVGSDGSSAKIGSSIATASIAISIVVMTIALAVVGGFRSSISDKITLLAGDYSLVTLNPDNYTEYISTPIDSDLVSQIRSVPDVGYLFAEVTRSAVVRDSANIFGLQLRGVDGGYPSELVAPYLTQGHFPDFDLQTSQTSIVLPLPVAQRLKLEIGDPIEIIFFGVIPLKMTFTLAATIQTGMEEIDKSLAFVSRSHLATISAMGEDYVDNYRIIASPAADIEQLASALDEQLGGDGMQIRISSDDYPHVFDWLEMLDNNVQLLLIIMLCVAGINMISAVLIIILENTRMVGVLKSMGMKNRTIQQIFIISTARITFKGLIFGLVVGVGLCLAQQYSGVVTLDSASYMVSTVPIALDFFQLTVLTVGTFVCLTLLTFIPTFIIYRLSPAKTIKFE